MKLAKSNQYTFKKLLILIILTLSLKQLPLYGQTYMYVGKLGQTPVFKRAEKLYGDWSVSYSDGRFEPHYNEHIGFSYEDVDGETLPDSKEYKYCIIRDKYKNSVQILTGMNMCEVTYVKSQNPATFTPTYKEVIDKKEILYWNDGTSIEFKNGLIE